MSPDVPLPAAAAWSAARRPAVSCRRSQAHVRFVLGQHVLEVVQNMLRLAKGANLLATYLAELVMRDSEDDSIIFSGSRLTDGGHAVRVLCIFGNDPRVIDVDVNAVAFQLGDDIGDLGI